MKRKRDFEAIRIFMRSFLMTSVCIACIAIVYVGCAKAYEQIRQTCFNDGRQAVTMDADHFKFFDFVYYFNEDK